MFWGTPQSKGRIIEIGGSDAITYGDKKLGYARARGRRDPEVVRIGDAIDFWRGEAVEPDKRLLLGAEMKLPGRA